ncbi:MAG: sugar kinase [Thalassotalea sp.]
MLVIGECMMELRNQSATSLAKSFAGDTYNAAVYAKRYAPSTEIKYLSAVGEDFFSYEMIAAWQSEGLSTEFIATSADLPIGVYAINTDQHGERSFTYWRKGSAASQMMSLIDTDLILSKADEIETVYFSGITLAILSEADKGALIAFIESLKAKGAKIAFDPNYRPKMWDSKEHAIAWAEKAYSISDIVFPGLEDHQDMFDQQDKEAIIKFFEQYSASEIIVKCGKDGVYTYGTEGESHLPFTPAPKQIDSTAAGDSFAGTYLGARSVGKSVADSVVVAAEVARIVVQHPGGIIDKSLL